MFNKMLSVLFLVSRPLILKTTACSLYFNDFTVCKWMPRKIRAIFSLDITKKHLSDVKQEKLFLNTRPIGHSKDDALPIGDHKRIGVFLLDITKGMRFPITRARQF